MGKIKDSIYNFLVRKNPNVRYEYERYVMEHISEHYTNRFKHLKILFALNWHYRIKNNKGNLIYFDNAIECDKIGANEKEDVIPSYEEEQIQLLVPGIDNTIEGDNTRNDEIEDSIQLYKGEKIQLTVTKISDIFVSLSWNDIVGVKEYVIEKYSVENDIFKKDGVIRNTTFNVRKLMSDTDYRFRVKGVTYNNEEVISNEVSVTTLCSINKLEANPYMDGPESKLCPRRTVHFLAKELMQYDVISFDIFDTLIFRPFSKPRDLFMLLDSKFDMLGFASIRQRAEMTVRGQAERAKGNREVTIDDIYAEIERRTGIPKEDGKQIEIDLEYNLCFANPYMLRLFNLLKHLDKRIILVSDMYFTSDILKRLLDKCGYTGYEDLFVSCEHNSNKYTGTLYRNVKNKLGVNLRYIHIGDNYKADVEAAKKEGIDTFFYKGVNDIGNTYRATQYGMQELIGSAYGGIINSQLHNGLNKFNVYYEYGYIYGGIYIYGFCQWIHRYAQKNNLDKVLFFARDGYIYKRVYDMLFDDIPSEYVYSSRIANSFLCAEKQRDNFLIRNIEVKANYELKTTINNLFDVFSLHFLDDKVAEYGLQLYHEISNLNVKSIERLVIDYWDEIIKNMETNNKLYEAYITSLLGGSKNIAVVDTGWQGTTLIGMKWLVETKWSKDCKVHCLMAASETSNPIVNQTQLMSEELKVYMFSSTFNRDLYLFHKKAYKNSLASYLFELFTQASHPTFSIVSEEDNGFKFNFGIPEVENYWMIDEIQNGIFDFCFQYNEIFKQYPVMHNISGHDAYIPFRFIAKNPRMFKQFFQEFSYSKATGGDVTNQKMETIGDLFREQKIRGK